jgi:hypothetical protein
MPINADDDQVDEVVHGDNLYGMAVGGAPAAATVPPR